MGSPEKETKNMTDDELSIAENESIMTHFYDYYKCQQIKNAANIKLLIAGYTCWKKAWI